MKRKAKPGLVQSIEDLFDFHRFAIKEPKSYFYQPYSPKLRTAK